jgi:glycine/D-amino acid oxidase-like deaminating enzyme
MGDVKRVGVVGAGAVGVTAAADLAADGHDVTLFERDQIGAGSTGRAAGICYDAFADRLDAAVAARALERFRDLAAETRFSVTDRPYVWLAREGDEKRERAIREQVPRMRDNDRDVTLLDPDALAAEFPGLETDDVAVAAVARDALCADPAEYAAVVAERASAAGATLRTGTEVAVDATPAGTESARGDSGPGATVVTPAGRERFDAVLVAAGAHTKPVLADAGVAIQVKPYRVQALVTAPSSAAETTPTLYDATRGFYCRAKAGGFLVGDGTEERAADPDDWDRTADEDFRSDALARLDAALSADGPTDVTDSWAGLCTATPDRDPLVGAVAPGLFVAVGWHGHGFMRAPALGERVADEIAGEREKESDNVLRAFDPARFDGDEEFAVVEGMTVE